MVQRIAELLEELLQRVDFVHADCDSPQELTTTHELDAERISVKARACHLHSRGGRWGSAHSESLRRASQGCREVRFGTGSNPCAAGCHIIWRTNQRASLAGRFASFAADRTSSGTIKSHMQCKTACPNETTKRASCVCVGCFNAKLCCPAVRSLTQLLAHTLKFCLPMVFGKAES